MERQGQWINVTGLVRTEGLSDEQIVQTLQAQSIFPNLTVYKALDNVLSPIIRKYKKDIILYEFRDNQQFWVHLSVALPILEALGVDFSGNDLQDQVIASVVENANQTPKAGAKLKTLMRLHSQLDNIVEGGEHPEIDDVGLIIIHIFDYEVMDQSYKVHGREIINDSVIQINH